MRYLKHLMIFAFVAVALGVGLRVGSYAVSGIDFVDGTKIPRAFNGPHYFTPTSITTTSTTSNDLASYHVDASAGAFVVSLPSSATDPPADGQCWEYSMTVAGAAVSFSPSAVGDLLNGSQAAYAGMDAVGDSVKICYDSGTTNYYFQSRFIN